jgi:hypothetical protein
MKIRYLDVPSHFSLYGISLPNWRFVDLTNHEVLFMQYKLRTDLIFLRNKYFSEHFVSKHNLIFFLSVLKRLRFTVL